MKNEVNVYVWSAAPIRKGIFDRFSSVRIINIVIVSRTVHSLLDVNNLTFGKSSLKINKCLVNNSKWNILILNIAPTR